MAYLYALAELSKGVGRKDNTGDYINLALVERIEALVDQLATMNAYMAEMVQATKDNKLKETAK